VVDGEQEGIELTLGLATGSSLVDAATCRSPHSIAIAVRSATWRRQRGSRHAALHRGQRNVASTEAERRDLAD
jgi:hypothetical protein